MGHMGMDIRRHGLGSDKADWGLNVKLFSGSLFYGRRFLCYSLKEKINMKKIILLTVFLMSGCMSKIPKLLPSPNSPPSVHNINFKSVDTNGDGNITIEEFSQVPQYPKTDSTTPIISIVIIIMLIGGLVYLTKFIKPKE